MREYPKHIKRLIREFGAIAYERELCEELEALAENFDAWKSGAISSGELSERIYLFTTGPARELYQKYDRSVLDLCVAHAIVTGILNRNDVPPELLEHLSGAIQFYEGTDDRSKSTSS